MKKLTTFVLVTVMLFTAGVGASGCYGSFALTKKVYTWNGTLGNKFVNSAVMWVLQIVPVYGIAMFGDIFILNLIEFYSGKNPMAMEAGEHESQNVTLNGKDYRIDARQNSFTVTPLNGGNSVTLQFDEATQSWYAISAAGKVKLAEFADASQQVLKLIKPDGKTLKVQLHQMTETAE